MNDKVSRYNIEIENENCILLYNTLSNKILPISFKDYASIETLLEYLPEFQGIYPNLYNAFKKSGFIINQEFDELAFIKLENKKRIYCHNNYRITINPTLDCNLKCWYCSVNYTGAKHNKEKMSDEVINNINNHIQFLATTQNAKSITLDWFGGEPLMYFDEVISKISNFTKNIALKNNVTFSQIITTNATLLNIDRIKQMRDFNFAFFQITLDGNEQRHNKIKYYSDKRGTYKDIVNNINLICEIIPNVQVALRINYDMQTLKNIQDILNDISENSKRCITIDFQRVWQVKCTDEIRQLLQKAKQDIKKSGFRSGFWAYRPLTFQRCYADSFHYYVINYNGKIFKCTARDYGDDKVIGILQPTGVIDWNDGLLGKIYESMPFENERCENCNMLPICMGPCVLKNYEARTYNGTVPCLYENAEYSLSSYVIDLARQRNLIK